MTLQVPGDTKSGRWKVGSPTHWPSATSSFTAVKSTSPRISATMYPTITPRKIEMRPRNPRNSTLNSTTATRVTVAVKGACW